MYDLAVYAVDDEGVVSLPEEVQVLRQGDDIIFDTDQDGMLIDNCIAAPNGPDLGTCVKEVNGVVVGMGTTCNTNGDCAAGQTCDLAQGDININGCGDACECYADITGSTGKVDLADLVIMKQEFMKPPVYADCNGDGKVDLQDLVIMKTQFLQTGCPACPA
jgi:hypothetical protein